MQKDGYSSLLPEGMLDYFEITKVEEKGKEIRISLEEKNNINPEGLNKYESKGFYPVQEGILMDSLSTAESQHPVPGISRY